MGKELNITVFTISHKFKETIEDSQEIYSLNIQPFDVLLATHKLPYKILKRLSNRDQTWSVGPSDWDAIKLKINKNVAICGFSIFSTTQESMKSTLTYKLKVNNNLLREEKTEIYFSPNRMIKVEFDVSKIVRLVSGDVLSMMHSIVDDQCKTYSGNLGVKECEYFKIESCSDGNNGTDTECGQFPEIYYL